ncbi:MAG: DUF1592 domain-containing protein [Opitutaceae bacterium]|nr:DUF1592 domain-containing protein [Verrucomicrobiales bacterium]
MSLGKTRAVWVALAVALASLHANAFAASASRVAFDKDVQPLLRKYCYSCHGDGKSKGEVTLDHWPDDATRIADRKTWETVIRVMQNHEMPPEKKPQPTPKERDIINKWIDLKVLQCDCDNPDPGRVTIRRLNRNEYNNTVRDLVGVNFKPGEDFPQDDSGYGFDNIGDVLSMPPVLVEKYLAAAEQILDTAIVIDEPATAVTTNRLTADFVEAGYNAKRQGNGWVTLNSIEEDDVVGTVRSRGEADYRVRVRAWASPDGTNPVHLTFAVDQKPITDVIIAATESSPQIYEASMRVPFGTSKLRGVVRRLKDGLSEAEAVKWKSGKVHKGNVSIEYLEIEGPYNVALRPISETHRRIFTTIPVKGQERVAAREIIGNFASRAYRRPVAAKDIDRLVTLAESAWKQGETFEGGVKVALKAILVSPHFLFRGEIQPEPGNPKSVHPLNDYALAARLSYFLWSSMPDAELFREAANKALKRNLDRQIRRMLQDPKARALVDNFAGQWLQIRNLAVVQPDPSEFPSFDSDLRADLGQETELFFQHIVQQDQSILDFLDADYTFVNERLAKHYGFTAITGNEFRKVSLAGTPRRGVLTQGSILTLTSNPTRTSPVKRGKWVLENLLNSPPPPPPPNVPELKEGKELTGTLRQRMEQHREDPVCASCHARMDPIGFGLENFDGIGAFRAKDAGNEIDPSGKLVTGESFNGSLDFAKLLREQKKDQFVKCLTEKLLTYSLGRGLEYFDKCAVEEISGRVAKKGFKFSELILEIAKSVPFQMRRGDAAGVMAAAQ